VYTVVNVKFTYPSIANANYFVFSYLQVSCISFQCEVVSGRKSQ